MHHSVILINLRFISSARSQSVSSTFTSLSTRHLTVIVRINVSPSITRLPLHAWNLFRESSNHWLSRPTNRTSFMDSRNFGYIHRASLGQSPDYVTDLLQPVASASSRSSLRDASRGDYVVPRTNWKTANRAFSTAASRAWNQLPTELKRTQSTSAFRRGLKTFLFNRTYCSE